MGYVQGIVSSAPRASIKKTLERYLVLPDGTYHFVHGEEDCPTNKPNPEVFNPAVVELDKVGIGVNETTYVGDSVTDYKAALSRGLFFIAVTTGFTTRELFLQEGVDEELTLNSFADVPDIFNKSKMP